MARFVKDVILDKPEDFVYFIMNDYLQKQKFAMSDWKGEPAYRTGDGFVEGYKYLKWSYGNGHFHLEAWIKGSFGGEMGLEGFMGCLVKKPYRESLEQLVQVLQQPLPQRVQSAPAGENGQAEHMAGTGSQMPGAAESSVQTENAGEAAGRTAAEGSPTQAAAPHVIPVQTVDHSKDAQTGLVLGIVAIVIGLFLPLFGIIFGCIGFSRARMGLGSLKDSQARAGKVCSIVGICTSAGIWVLNILLSVFLYL